MILVARYLLDLVSDWLNISHLSDELPEEFKGYYDAERYRLSQSYLLSNTKFGIFVDTFQTLVTIVFILVGGFNFVDQIAMRLGEGPIITGLIFAGILIFASKILNLPFSLYSTFVIEEKYGFNRTTFKTYLLDIIKVLVLTILIGGILLAAIIWFFEKTGDLAWVYCWIMIILFQFFFMYIAPVIIMPIFNKFVPLEKGELRTAIEKYAKAQNFKMKGIFKMDGSKRSSKSNAFFTGFGRWRRIVLLDTLIDNHSTNELVSILAHEMGHYKKKHIIKAIARSIIVTGLTLFLLSFFIENEKLFAAFKMEHISVYASLFFFGFLYTPMALFVGIIENMISRKNEYEADAFAIKTYGDAEAMINALKKLSVDNLSNLTPHPFKVFMSYSHPPILERVKAIKKLQAS
jgi:STE24 endopeptidase